MEKGPEHQTLSSPETGTGQAPEAQPHFAGFWIRLVAFLVDEVLLNVASTIIRYAAGLGLPWGQATPLDAFNVIGLLLDLAYYGGFWTWRGQTPGLMLVGIKIVKTDGSPLGLGDSLIRYVGYIVSGITLGLGFLWIAFDRRKQGFHDKIASTYVVKQR